MEECRELVLAPNFPGPQSAEPLQRLLADRQKNCWTPRKDSTPWSSDVGLLELQAHALERSVQPEPHPKGPIPQHSVLALATVQVDQRPSHEVAPVDVSHLQD